MRRAFTLRRRYGIAMIAVGLISSAGLGATPEAAKPIDKGQRVFSAGHSFHFFMPDILRDVVQTAGIKDHEQVGANWIGGSRVIQHWDDKNNRTQNALRTGKVDVLTLSPIYLPDEGIENFTKLAVEHNPNIRITIQENWIPFDDYDEGHFPPRKRPIKVDHNVATAAGLREMHAPYFKSIDEHVQALNKKYGKDGKQVLYVVPVGQAVNALREKIIEGKAPGLKVQEDLFTDPLGHAKPQLQVLSAYCYFGVVYRRSPVGLPVPAILVRTQAPEAEKLNSLLQQLAWGAVRRHPLSGVKAE